MAYEKRTWVSGVTKCSAENFNHMENGIEMAQKGVDELNTKINNTGESVASVLFGVQDHWVISTMIPLENADTYNITINQMERYGTTDRPVFEWNVMKYKHGFVILNNNADMSYYFGEAHANKIFTVTFTVS